MAMWVAPGAVGKAVYFACKFWLLALPLVWLILIDGKRPSWSRPTRGGMLVGGLTGLAIAVGILAVYRLFVHGRIDADTLRTLAAANRFDEPAVYLAFAAYLTLVNSLLEEYVWRWFVLEKCENLAASAAAVVGSSLFFTLHHVIALKAYLPWSGTIVASLGVFVGGVLWGWMYVRYRSVWPGYISHVLVDAAVLAVGWFLLFSVSSA